MSLLNCPECGHEVSTNAVACQNCGRPVHAPPVVEKKVVISQLPRESSFPPWAVAGVVIVAIILLFVGYMVMRQSDERANTNVNVDVAGRRQTTESRNVTIPPTSDTQTSAPGSMTTVPGTTTAVPNAPPPDKGSVVINAKIAPVRGEPTAARSTKFYMLDKDLETILSEARLEPIEGNSLTGSLGLAIVFPDRYGDFQRAAMKAINAHAKYTGTTSSAGTASLKGIIPNEYYLFAISRIGRGFALWNAPVSVVAGDNVMNLSPQSVTDIPDPNG